jgi:phosphatidylglycerophosphate synthase
MAKFLRFAQTLLLFWSITLARNSTTKGLFVSLWQQAVAVNNLGKWKTATQMTALTFLLASRDPRYLKHIFVGVSIDLLLFFPMYK